MVRDNHTVARRFSFAPEGYILQDMSQPVYVSTNNNYCFWVSNINESSTIFFSIGGGLPSVIHIVGPAKIGCMLCIVLDQETIHYFHSVFYFFYCSVIYIIHLSYLHMLEQMPLIIHYNDIAWKCEAQTYIHIFHQELPSIRSSIYHLFFEL